MAAYPLIALGFAIYNDARKGNASKSNLPSAWDWAAKQTPAGLQAKADTQRALDLPPLPVPARVAPKRPVGAPQGIQSMIRTGPRGLPSKTLLG